jgi:hypothetical protein
MAMSTETSGVDYARYATYHTLKSLRDMEPEQWMNLVDHARDDLHTNYVFSGEEYPLEVKFETTHQRMERREIIKWWRVAFPDWNLTPRQYTSILTTLFYAIWAQDFVTGRSDLTTGRHTFSSAQATARQTKNVNYRDAHFLDTPSDAQNAATERLQPFSSVQATAIQTKSVNYRDAYFLDTPSDAQNAATERLQPFSSAQATARQTKSVNYRHVHFLDTSSDAQNAATERLQPDVQPVKILQHVLEKADEKFGGRYSGWIKEHPNAVEELSSFLRSEVWEICKEVEKDGFATKQ